MYVEQAVKALLSYPLCDRCLGRLFALAGYGLSNEERGKALKTLIIMEFHKKINEGDQKALELFRKIAPNLGQIAKPLYEKLFKEDLTINNCYICNNQINKIINKFSNEISKELLKRNFKSFVIGIKKNQAIFQKEEELVSSVKIPTWESLRNELRREIGKEITVKTSIPVNFVNPHVIIHIDIEKGTYKFLIPSIMLLGRYWKLGRYISQSKWIMKDGRRKYKLSIIEALEPLANMFKGENVVLHASGREDVDVRVLGNGRPFVIEVKKPLVRDMNVNEVNKFLGNATEWVRFEIRGFCKRKVIRELKGNEARKSKIYKALVLASKPLAENDIGSLSKFFKNRVIEQRTPKRVLHRKKDILRRRTVHEVKGILIHPHIAEFLIKAEGGLYIKELIHGDEGRTTPSFSKVLNNKLSVLELDVLKVT